MFQLFDTSGYDVPKGGMKESFKTKKEIAANIRDATKALVWPEHYLLVDCPRHLKQARDLISTTGSFIFDTETSGLNPWRDRVLGVSLFVAGQVFVIPIEHQLIHRLTPHDSFRKYLGEAFAEATVRRTNHNIKFDLHFIRETFKIPVGEAYCDTLLQSQVINPDSSSEHGLKQLAALYGLPGAEGGGNYTAQFGKTSWAYIEPKLACYYMGKDCELVDGLKKQQDITLDLPDKEKLKRLFWDVEMPMLNLTFEMEAHGMRVDREYARKVMTPKVYTEHAKAIEALRPFVEPHLAHVKGESVAKVLASPTKLEKVFFDKLDVPQIKHITLKNGPMGPFTKRTLDKEAIAALQLECLPMKLLGDFRKWDTVKKMFVDTLPTMAINDFIHFIANVIGADTGRMSFSKPNFQQIPSRMGPLIRNAFIPDEGNVFMSADFSSQEMRILAHYTKDPGLIKFFMVADALDPYSETAIMGMKILDPLFDEAGFRAMSKEERKKTEIYRNFKALVLGLGFGMGVRKYARNTGLSEKQAKSMYDAYHAAFPRVGWYHKQCIKFAKKTGYITTLLGRQRPLLEINNTYDSGRRTSAERASMNTPIQGSAADMVKLAAVKVHRLIKERGWPVRIALIIHDEILYEMNAAWAKQNSDCISDIIHTMETALPLIVPMKSSATFETRWGSEISADELDDFYDDLVA